VSNEDPPSKPTKAKPGRNLTLQGAPTPPLLDRIRAKRTAPPSKSVPPGKSVPPSKSIPPGKSATPGKSFPVRKVKGLPPRKPQGARGKGDDDRPRPTAGEMVVTRDDESYDDDGETIAVNITRLRTPTAVLDAYAEDALLAIAGYEALLSSEMDPERVGRLHYEIARLYVNVLGDLSRASHHFDRALVATPQHLPTVVLARQVRLRQGNAAEALELFDREIEQCPERHRKGALLVAKARVLDDVLDRPDEARAAYQAAAQMIEADPVVLKALEHSDTNRRDWAALSTDLEAIANAMSETPRLRAAVVVQRARLHEIHADQPDLAAELYESALAIDEGVAPEVLPVLRRLHEHRQRWRDLVRVLEREAALTSSPEVRAAALYRIGRVHAEHLGNLNEAITALEASTEVLARATTLQALVELHARQGNAEALATTLTDLVERIPDDREQIAILLRLGQLFRDRLEDDDGAITALEAARALCPSDLPVLHQLIPLYARHERFAELVRVYEEEAESSLHTPQRALAHAQAAEILERLGDRDAATAHHERALDLDPTRHGSMRALVRLYTHAEAHRKRVDLYERFLDRVDESRRIMFLFEVGQLHAGPLSDPEEAVQTYRRVLKLQPRHLGAIQAIEHVAEAAERWPTLLEAIELEIEIVDDAAQLVTLWHRAAELLDRRLSRRADSITHYRRALAIDACHRPTLAALAAIFTFDRRFSDLATIYDRQLELDPTGPAAVALLERLGEIHEHELSHTEQAAQCYQRALDQDPRAHVAGAGLARILEQQHKWAELAALRDRQREHASDPEDRVRLALVAGELYEDPLDDLRAATERYATAHQLQPTDRPAIEALRRVRAQQADWATLADELEREAAIDDLSYAAEIRAERLDEPSKAVACLRRVLGLDPKNLHALVALEPLLLRLGDHDALIDLYDEQSSVFEDSGARVAALHERARLIERHHPDRGDELIEIYSAILTTRAEDLRALEALEALAVRRGEPKALARVDARLARLAPRADLRAAYLTRRAESMEVGGNPESLEVYREVLRLDPQNRGALRGLTRMAELLRNDEALAYAAERGAENIDQPRAAADAWVKAGTIKAERLGDAAAAVIDFERALVKWPDHPGAATSLSRVMGELGRHRSLVERLTRAAESATDSERIAALWLEIAQLQASELDMRSAAQASLERLIHDQPTRAQAMLELARLYVADRRADEASALLTRCLATKPNREITHAAHSLMAEAHEKAGRADEAFSHYAAALEANPDDIELLRRVARLQLDQKHYAAAADAASRLLGLSTDKAARVEALRWMAEALVGLGRIDEAMDTLAEAVALQGPRSSAAKEMVERASSPEHWERYVDALKGYLNERAPSGRSRAALFDEIAELQHERLGDDNASMSTLIRGLRENEGDGGLRLRLAQRLAGVRRPADAIQQLQILLADDASRAEGWRLMAQCFGEIVRPREQGLTLSSLVVLGDARAEDTEVLKTWVPHTRGIRPGALVPAGWVELQLGGDPQTAVANLLAAICDGLGKLRPPDLSVWGVASRDRIAPRSDHPLRVLVDRLCSFFALEELDVYVHRHQGRGVGIENTSRPSLLLPIWLGELHQSQQIFLITQALAHLARGTYLVHLMAPRELGLTIAAAIRAIVPGYGSKLGAPEALDDRARLIMRGIPRRKRKMHESTAQVCATMTLPEPTALVHWLHQTAGRLAAIVADDLVGTVQVIRRTDELGQEQGADLLARSAVINDLLRMWMTEPAMIVRRRIGLVPAAAG